MATSGPTLNTKIKFIPFGIIIICLIISARLYYLQITQSSQLFTQSQKNFTRIEKIQSPRGNIVDRSGNLLATNRPLTNLYWQGSGNTNLSDIQWQTLQKIAYITDKPLTTDDLLITTIKMAEKKI